MFDWMWNNVNEILQWMLIIVLVFFLLKGLSGLSNTGKYNG